MQGAYFFGAIGAFAVGTTAALLGYITISGSALVLIIVVAVTGLLHGTQRSDRLQTVGPLLLGIVLFVGFGVGALRASYDVYQKEALLRTGTLAQSVDKHVTLSGAIADDPVVTEKHQKLVVEVEGERGKVIAFAPLYPALAYGDVVEARGVLKRPEAFVTESGRTFDYPAYLAKDNIFYVLDRPHIVTKEGWRGSVVRRAFIRIKRSFVTAIEKAVSEPYAGFATGVVLGVDGALSDAHEEAFRRAGLIHVVVVSGYNITLAGDMTARALARFPAAIASFGSFLGIVAFIMLTGASATAIRAGIMGSLVLMARLTKRRYDINRALFFAGGLMIAHTPAILLHDPSFQLSFLATWGLGNLTPFATRFFAWLPKVGGFRDIAATTLATQAAVTPLLIYMSGSVSALSLPANIAVLPMIPFLMFAALAVGIFGLLPSLALVPLAGIVQGIGAYAFGIVEVIDRIPFASVRLPLPPVWLLGCIYFAMVLLVVWTQDTRKQGAPFRLAERGAASP